MAPVLPAPKSMLISVRVLSFLICLDFVMCVSYAHVGPILLLVQIYCLRHVMQ